MSYQIGTNAAVDIKTFKLTASNKFSEETITLPAAAQVSGVKFILKSAKSSYYVSKITLTPKTSSGGGEERNLSFGDATSFDAEVGGTFSAPTLTGATDGVAYASSNEAVASVNASTGAVTINGMGYAKITASAEADATYKAGSASYDIYVYGKGTIDDLKKYITSTTAKDIYFNLTSTTVVTYASTNYAYMEDGTAGIYIYKSGHGLTAGNSFTGKVKATGTLYKELYELTSFTPADAAGTSDIHVRDWTIKDLLESENTGYKMAESMRVKLTGVTATTSATGTSCTIEQGGASTTLALYNSLSVTAGGVYDITGYPYNNDGTWEFRVYEESCLGQTGSKTVATVTFAEESYTVETNGNITVSATKNSTTSPIVYSISPEDDNVSIDENTGYILAGATAGTYTITATVAENNDYTSASATCVLTVTAPAPPSYNITAPTYYKKITSTDELAVGGTYLIVCEGAKKGLTQSVSAINYTQGENNTITNETAATLGEFELVNTNESYGDAPLYQFAINNKYLHGTTSTTLSMKNTIANETKWTIDFDESGNVNITNYATIVANDTRLVYFNKDGNYIRHYLKSKVSASNYIPVQLYQKVTDLAISTLTNGYATFVTDVPYVMPKGACGYAVTVAPQAGVITTTKAYNEGSQVPAQTALLIGGASGTNYYPAVLKEDVTATYKGDNYMEGARTAEGYTNSQKGVAVYYYKLALNSDEKPGFYYGAEGGAAFQLTKPTTAFLAVPQSITPVNGYLIDFEGETTGIDSIGQTDGNANGAIYNLNGIRMAQPLRNLPKGVYIVNGKKVIRF
ncbi:MAG: hypothetical protein MSH66_06365 [Bacteroidales bacterium]|nr:hypothetical protein [Bacteroidales bacterium]